jgi:hypothetical protein
VGALTQSCCTELLYRGRREVRSRKKKEGGFVSVISMLAIKMFAPIEVRVEVQRHRRSISYNQIHLINSDLFRSLRFIISNTVLVLHK